MNKVYIITGGTINRVSPHFALSAPAYGKIGSELYAELSKAKELPVILIRTKMADPDFTHDSFTQAGLKSIETNADLKKYLLYLNSQQDTGAIILSVAVADFEIHLPEDLQGKRLSSSHEIPVTLVPSEKLLPLIRKEIFVVSFKTLFNENSPIIASEKALKNTRQSDIVFVNDIGSRKNGIAKDDKLVWMNSREETIKVMCMTIFAQYDLFCRRCGTCGADTPESFKNVCYERCECGAKRRSVMHYRTILNYKYNIG